MATHKLVEELGEEAGEEVVKEPERLSTEEIAKRIYFTCPQHAKFFPGEDPERPLTEWSYNSATFLANA